jgi:serine protease Do
MKFPSVKTLKMTGIVVVLVGAITAGIMAAPVIRGQALRERPLVGQLFGPEIGVTVRDASPSGADDTGGVVIETVGKNSPAERAGLKVGDVVTSFDGERVRSSRQFARLIAEASDGRQVDASVIRNGEKMSVKVTPQVSEALGRAMEPLRSLRQSLPDRFAFSVPGRSGSNFLNRWTARTRGRLGVVVENLTGQLGDYFGTQDGVLVTSVDAGTPASAAGLKAGDVITKINGQVVRDTGSLRTQLAGTTGSVTITVMRDRKEQTVNVTIN